MNNDARDEARIREFYRSFRSSAENDVNTRSVDGLKNTARAGVDEPAFAGEQATFNQQENLILACYRHYQENRELSTGDHDATVEQILTRCRPAIDQYRIRSSSVEQPAKRVEEQVSWLTSVTRRWQASFNPLTIGAGSFAVVAVAVVALSVFNFTQPPEQVAELAGVNAYASLFTDPVSHDLQEPGLDGLGFSPTTDAVTRAYLNGSLQGLLLIAVTANNKSLSLTVTQALVKLAASTAAVLSNADADSGGDYSRAIVDLQQTIKRHANGALTDDEGIVDALRTMLSISSEREKHIGLTDYQSLGAWSRLLLTVVDDESPNPSYAVIEQLVTDAEPIHQALMSQRDLPKHQQSALAAFALITQDVSNGWRDASDLQALKQAAITIDRSFRL